MLNNLYHEFLCCAVVCCAVLPCRCVASLLSCWQCPTWAVMISWTTCTDWSWTTTGAWGNPGDSPLGDRPGLFLTYMLNTCSFEAQRALPRLWCDWPVQIGQQIGLASVNNAGLTTAGQLLSEACQLPKRGLARCVCCITLVHSIDVCTVQEPHLMVASL